MKNKKRICFSVIAGLMLIVFCTGCVTSTRVHINSDVEGSEVYIDGEKVGTTPTEIALSNAIWEDPDVVLKKDGYKDLHTNVKKEVKTVNLISGLLIWSPSLLWVYGPKANQNYMMIPE